MATRPQSLLLPSMMMKILFCSPFLLFSFSCYPREIQASEIQFNTIDISHHLSPVMTCNRASKTGGLKNRLQVVHRHGPCAHEEDSDSKQQVLNLAEILANDQKLRVNSIQARTKRSSSNLNTNKHTLGLGQLPARSGDFLGSGNYIVAIGLGMPKRRLYLIFDTGSGITWTQCLPCLGHCYRQKNHIFDPSASTTYSKISCHSDECPQYLSAYCHHLNSTTCTYGAVYADGSYTTGPYSRDTLTLTHNDVFRNFRFGCGQNNSGSFAKAAGILGLSRSPVSFVSQTAKKYSRVFSYCLPSDIRSSTGFLTFGRKYNNNNNHNNNNKVITTPFAPNPQGDTYYYIEITGITVGGTRLPIMESVFKTTGTVIDSGTTFTSLPPAAYDAARKEFKKQMTGDVFKYKIAPGRATIYYGDILDTCFDITNINSKKLKLPTMSISFKGNAILHLDPSGILYVVNSTLACFAFAGNTDPTGFAVFGTSQHLNYQVMYDVPRNQLSFQSNPNCQY